MRELTPALIERLSDLLAAAIAKDLRTRLRTAESREHGGEGSKLEPAGEAR
jgi:hypothetical protein